MCVDNSVRMRESVHTATTSEMNTAVRAGSRVQSIGHGTVETGEKKVYCTVKVTCNWCCSYAPTLLFVAYLRLGGTWRMSFALLCSFSLFCLLLLLLLLLMCDIIILIYKATLNDRQQKQYTAPCKISLLIRWNVAVLCLCCRYTAQHSTAHSLSSLCLYTFLFSACVCTVGTYIYAHCSVCFHDYRTWDRI